MSEPSLSPAPSSPALAAAVLFRPSRAFARLAAAPAPRFGLGCGLLLGASWAALAAGLAAGGHQPSMTRGLPVAADDYYAIAALYLTPLWVGLTALTAAVAHALARGLGGRGSMAASLGAIGAAYALPLWLAFVVPDLVVFALAGHDALGVAMRFTGPLALAWVTLRTVQAIGAVHGIGRGRACVAALVAAVVQAVPAALLVR